MNQQGTKIALVTGASSGIGHACAIALARSGFRVFGSSRNPVAGQTMQWPEDLRPNFEPTMITMDVDSAASVDDTVASIVQTVGRIDLLVNCAGFGIGGAIEDTSDDEAAAIFQTNVFGILRVCRAVLPTMRAQRSGRIVNISSIGGRIALPFQGLYSATKFAVEGLTESLRMEIRTFGIRASLVEPGDFSTGFTDRRTRVKNSEQGSTYAEAFASALAVVEKDERSGASPESIGRLVARIARAKSPRGRYLIGPAPQRLAVRLKSVLPSCVFEWALRMYYKVN